MEIVIKRTSKYLGDCKARNICRELKKLKEKDIASLEAANATLSAQVQELKMTLALKKDEVWVLKKQQAKSLGWIWEAIGYSGDIINKAYLFDNEVKTELRLLAPKFLFLRTHLGSPLKCPPLLPGLFVLTKSLHLSQPSWVSPSPRS